MSADEPCLCATDFTCLARSHPVARAQNVTRLGCEWVATCDHGGDVWTVHRGTERHARRSLRAHTRAEHH